MKMDVVSFCRPFRPACRAGASPLHFQQLWISTLRTLSSFCRRLPIPSLRPFCAASLARRKKARSPCRQSRVQAAGNSPEAASRRTRTAFGKADMVPALQGMGSAGSCFPGSSAPGLFFFDEEAALPPSLSLSASNKKPHPPEGPGWGWLCRKVQKRRSGFLHRSYFIIAQILPNVMIFGLLSSTNFPGISMHFAHGFPPGSMLYYSQR